MKHFNSTDAEYLFRFLRAIHWTEDEIQWWLKQKIPYLNERTFLEAFNDGDEEAVKDTLLRAAERSGYGDKDVVDILPINEPEN